MDDGIKFRRKIGSKGGVLGVSLPIEVLEYLNMKDQDVIILHPKKGKFGKYLALWMDKKEIDVKNESTTNIHTKD